MNVIVRRDVIFNETDFGQTPHVQVSSSIEVEDHSETGDERSGDQDGIEQPESQDQRRSQRQRHPPVRYGRDEYADVAIMPENPVKHIAYNVCQISEPKSIEEALESDQAKEWKLAADSEYQSLIDNDTWELVEIPEGHTPVGSRWLFKVKYRNDGKIERFKGRLVAKGYSQKYRIDYDETFSPVVRFSSFRALLAFAVQNNMLIHQMDVVTAFLNGSLDEEIYMQQPSGYVIPGNEHVVCKLKKSIYGFKQSPRCWNTVFRKYMEGIDFKQSPADPCVYVRCDKDNMAVVAVYVDDLIIITKINEEMKSMKESLAGIFKMKDMGKLHYCLGINIEQDENNKCLWIHQRQYILKLIEKYGLSEAKTTSTPADPGTKLKKHEGVGNDVDLNNYQSLVGSLLYAAIATRPDISKAVGDVSKFNSNPSQTHLAAAKRILRYLKGTTNLAIKYQRSETNTLLGYSDADWAGYQDDRHSTTGNLFIMSGGPISWLSKKQAIVALSTAEAEYVALSTATQEAVWLQRLLVTTLKAIPNEPIILMEDNQGAIAIAKNPIAHARTKHINIRYHFIRDYTR